MAKDFGKKKDIGKGLGALLSGISADLDSVAETPRVPPNGATVAMIDIADVEVNPWQPRSEFEAEALQELSASIKIHGLIQPITVRRLENASVPYQLISGERRLRAAQMAGLTEIPAYIRQANDQEMLEMALVENIQRADLSPLEVALTYHRLKEECNLTDEDVARRVAKERSTITNYLRLLKLPPNVQDALRNKIISMGHAKALAGVTDLLAQTEIFKQVVENNLSVRATEALVAAYENPKKKTGGATNQVAAAKKDSTVRDIQDRLVRVLDTKVDLKRDKSGKGEIVIKFTNDQDLNRLLDLLENNTF
jgi:ParB family transcriptional regulator, chromosome partitioning protein